MCVCMCVSVGVCMQEVLQKTAEKRQGRKGKYDWINNVGGQQEMSQKSGDTLIKPFKAPHVQLGATYKQMIACIVEMQTS